MTISIQLREGKVMPRLGPVLLIGFVAWITMSVWPPFVASVVPGDVGKALGAVSLLLAMWGAGRLVRYLLRRSPPDLWEKLIGFGGLLGMKISGSYRWADRYFADDTFWLMFAYLLGTNILWMFMMLLGMGLKTRTREDAQSYRAGERPHA